MFHVAVILNESELIRAGYADVVPKLCELPRFASYRFSVYTTSTMTQLFGTGDHDLSRYDSIVIATNATSDRTVLEALRSHRSQLADFLAGGRGLLILSQKKLSVPALEPVDEPLVTGFLPSQYEYTTMERPKEEVDSGKGTITADTDGARHAILEYPRHVDVHAVAARCDRNEFRPHYYRSHLRPSLKTTYSPLLCDSSHAGQPRCLLMVNRTPTQGERVIVSTMALDWVFHADLLTNTIVYVTEGLPRLAFVNKQRSKDGDYDFLLTSMRLSNIPHSEYVDLSDIPTHLSSVHNTYIFSPAWAPQEIGAFLRSPQWRPEKSGAGRPAFRKLYYFHRLDGNLMVAQHSSYSTLDVVIERSAAWITAQYRGGLWAGGFWNTHDVMQMMQVNRFDPSPYAEAVLTDVARHFRDGSYDAVMGSTCGLLEMLSYFLTACPAECNRAGFGRDSLRRVCEWIIEHFPSQSSGDKVTAYLALRRIPPTELVQLRIAPERLSGMLAEVVAARDVAMSQSSKLSEIDVARWLRLVAEVEPENTRLLEVLIYELRDRQRSEGLWTDIRRTAHVLTMLLEKWDTLAAVSTSANPKLPFDAMVYDGIMALRSNYNWNDAHWDHDIQTTAKAMTAIGLFNSNYKYTTQDFLQIVTAETSSAQSALLLNHVKESLEAIHRQHHDATMTNMKLRDSLQAATRRGRLETVWRYVAVCTFVLLFTIIGSLLIEDPSTAKRLVIAAAPLSATASAVIGVLIGVVVARRVTRDSHKK